MRLFLNKLHPFYPVFHGLVLASCYFVVKVADYKGTLMNLGHSLLLCSVIILLYSLLRNKTVKFTRGLICKGGLFGFTQILIFTCLRESGVGNTMLAAVVGSLLAAFLGKFLLGEKTSRREHVGYVLIVVGSAFYAASFVNVSSASIFAFLAGLGQGATFFLTRKNTIDLIDPESIVLSNTLVGMLVIYGWYFFSTPTDFAGSFNFFFTTNVYLLTFVIFIAQFSLCYTMNHFETQRGSIMSLSRLPASFLLDFLFLSITITFYELVSSLLIIVGLLLPFKKFSIFFLQSNDSKRKIEKDDSVRLLQKKNVS